MNLRSSRDRRRVVKNKKTEKNSLIDCIIKTHVHKGKKK